MRPLVPFTILSLVLALAACHSGNLESADDYDAPPAPPVQHPNYDPYTAYGEANATWRPPVADRNGTIVKPTEPSTEADRPDYERAPWATGAAGGAEFAPPGTF
jgi:hypothetical protein